MSKDCGGTAFPFVEFLGYTYNGKAGPTKHEKYHPGMTLRDHVVVAMMAAWRQSEVGTPFEDRIDSQCLAQLAAEDADAMMAEREKQ